MSSSSRLGSLSFAPMTRSSMSKSHRRSEPHPRNTHAHARAAAKRAAEKSGKFEDIRLVTTLRQIEGKPSDVAWILCPWLDRFPGHTSVWVSVLAAHDANGGLLEALRPSKRCRPRVYAAVFAVDPLRSATQLVRSIKMAGIHGVINFPSVSFIDGMAGAILNGLSLGIEREIDFLETCARQGLRTAGVVGSAQAARRLVRSGVDFLIVHGGPPTSGAEELSQEVMTKIAGIARSTGVLVIPMSQILQMRLANGEPSSTVYEPHPTADSPSLQTSYALKRPRGSSV